MPIPELKRLGSDDLSRSELPDDPSDCRISLIASIGEKGKEGADYFYFDVVTTKFISRSGPIWGRRTLLLDTFYWEAIERSLSALLAENAGETWQEVGHALSAYMHWEFENYVQPGA